MSSEIRSTDPLSFFFQELHYNLTCKNYDYFFELKLFSDFKNRYSFSFRLFFQNNLKFEYKNLLQSKIVGRHAFLQNCNIRFISILKI
jgi:hypothetical protein